MHIVRSNRIDLDIEPIRSDELLVNIVAVGAHVIYRLFVQAATVLLLAKQLLPASTVSLRIVNAHLVILSIERFLHKRFLELDVANEQAIVLLSNHVILVDELLEVFAEKLHWVACLHSVN